MVSTKSEASGQVSGVSESEVGSGSKALCKRERSPTYRSWEALKYRCLQPRCKRYADYGGRGIKVCERWLTFKNFLADMGEKPTRKHSIDRIDNDGNYSCGHCDDCLINDWPANCRWATDKEQGNNSRQVKWLTLDGKTLTLTQWSEKLNIGISTLSLRLKYGWSVERALTTRPEDYKSYKGKGKANGR